MIRFKSGDILTEDAEALVNTVNCVGVMGRGVALQFKKALPDNFRAYAEACRRGEVETGRMFVFETGRLTNPRYIINFPTKRHWRAGSRVEYIESGLVDLARVIRDRNIRSIAVPPLGSGLGGLDWSAVRTRIEKKLGEIDNLEVVIFEPDGAPSPASMVRTRNVPEMTVGRAALVGLMDRYLKGLLDPFVTLLEVHKLMYFMQEAGQPLHLKFSKGTYGPYAENLRHVLNAIEGHFISGYVDGGDAPGKELTLLPDAVEDAFAFIDECFETRKRFDRVADLTDGFESPFGLELLSTVHWILVKDTPYSRSDLVSRIHAWNIRKKQFTPKQIGLAVDVLDRKGWTNSHMPLEECPG